MKFNDVSLGLIVLAGGIAILLSAMQFSAIPGQAYGADTMPKVIGGSTILLGLFLVGRSVMAGERRPTVTLAGWAHEPLSILNLFLAVGLVVAYVVLSPTLGFVLTALAVQAVLMLVRGVRPLTALAVSLCATIVIQQAFGRLLLVPLPRSAFLGFLW